MEMFQGCSAARQARALQTMVRLSVLSLLLLVSAGSDALAQSSNANWLTGPPADAFWAQLAQSPYAQAGDHGFTLYMLSYSSCSNCIVFLRDFWESRKGTIQLREIFAPINQPHFLDEAADMALTRNPAFADAYYHRTRTAPPASSSPERQVALKQVEDFVTRTNAFYRQIGHIQDGYPTFVFRAHDAKSGQDRLWIISGWGPELAADMDRWVKQGNPQ